MDQVRVGGRHHPWWGPRTRAPQEHHSRSCARGSADVRRGGALGTTIYYCLPCRRGGCGAARGGGEPGVCAPPPPPTRAPLLPLPSNHQPLKLVPPLALVADHEQWSGGGGNGHRGGWRVGRLRVGRPAGRLDRNTRPPRAASPPAVLIPNPPPSPRQGVPLTTTGGSATLGGRGGRRTHPPPPRRRCHGRDVPPFPYLCALRGKKCTPLFGTRRLPGPGRAVGRGARTALTAGGDGRMRLGGRRPRAARRGEHAICPAGPDWLAAHPPVRDDGHAARGATPRALQCCAAWRRPTGSMVTCLPKLHTRHPAIFGQTLNSCWASFCSYLRDR